MRRDKCDRIYSACHSSFANDSALGFCDLVCFISAGHVCSGQTLRDTATDSIAGRDSTHFAVSTASTDAPHPTAGVQSVRFTLSTAPTDASNTAIGVQLVQFTLPTASADAPNTAAGIQLLHFTLPTASTDAPHSTPRSDGTLPSQSWLRPPSAIFMQGWNDYAHGYKFFPIFPCPLLEVPLEASVVEPGPEAALRATETHGGAMPAVFHPAVFQPRGAAEELQSHRHDSTDHIPGSIHHSNRRTHTPVLKFRPRRSRQLKSSPPSEGGNRSLCS